MLTNAVPAQLLALLGDEVVGREQTASGDPPNPERQETLAVGPQGTAAPTSSALSGCPSQVRVPGDCGGGRPLPPGTTPWSR